MFTAYAGNGIDKPQSQKSNYLKSLIEQCIEIVHTYDIAECWIEDEDGNEIWSQEDVLV